jgi:hypothetical protein
VMTRPTAVKVLAECSLALQLVTVRISILSAEPSCSETLAPPNPVWCRRRPAYTGPQDPDTEAER